MRVLLDTHLLLWSLSSPAKLPKSARKTIESSDVYVSAASIWEISIKASVGKLRASPMEVLAALQPAEFLVLPVSGQHAARVRDLPPVHRDLFDRMLVAQALCEPMILLTNDEALRACGSVITVT